MKMFGNPGRERSFFKLIKILYKNNMASAKHNRENNGALLLISGATERILSFL